MGSTNHKSSRSLSASNIFPSFATPENTKFHFEKLKQPKMASNSINFSKINSKPARSFFKVFNFFSFLNKILRNKC